MKITNVKQIRQSDLIEKYERMMGQSPSHDTETFFRWLCEEEVLFVHEDEKPKARLRITFPLFIVCVLLAMIFGAIKWLFTGNAYFNTKSFIIRSMVKWDKFCRFKIVT